MKRLFIHIGTGKTGSTAIQEAFYSAHKESLLCDCLYPKLLGKKHHNELCTLVMPHDRIRRDIKSKFPQDDAYYREYKIRLHTKEHANKSLI